MSWLQDKKRELLDVHNALWGTDEESSCASTVELEGVGCCVQGDPASCLFVHGRLQGQALTFVKQNRQALKNHKVSLLARKRVTWVLCRGQRALIIDTILDGKDDVSDCETAGPIARAAGPGREPR